MLVFVVFDLVLSSGVIIVSPVVGTLNPFPFPWLLLNNKAARVEVNISLSFLYWVGIALHP